MSTLNLFICILRTTELHFVQHLALALLAHRLATEQSGQTHVWARTHEVLPWTTHLALGGRREDYRLP